MWTTGGLSRPGSRGLPNPGARATSTPSSGLAPPPLGPPTGRPASWAAPSGGCSSSPTSAVASGPPPATRLEAPSGPLLPRRRRLYWDKPALVAARTMRWHAGAIWWRWAARTAPCASSASPRLMLRVAASRPTGQAARAAPHPLSSCGPLAPSAHGSPPWPGAPHRPTATPLAPRWALCMQGQRTGRSTCSTASAVERRGA
mmetsp:Transcript_31312/g.70345  ORF Transcript_31312/g.70345 Transcript_31312/m.70345 type:complete len:202 (+) Transcript_31312:1368-1973(+)